MLHGLRSSCCLMFVCKIFQVIQSDRVIYSYEISGAWIQFVCHSQDALWFVSCNCSTGFGNIYRSAVWTRNFINHTICETSVRFIDWFTCFTFIRAIYSLPWRSKRHVSLPSPNSYANVEDYLERDWLLRKHDNNVASSNCTKITKQYQN